MVLIGLSCSIEKHRVGFTFSFRGKFFKLRFNHIKVIQTTKFKTQNEPPRLAEADPSLTPVGDDPANYATMPASTPIIQAEDM